MSRLPEINADAVGLRFTLPEMAADGVGHHFRLRRIPADGVVAPFQNPEIMPDGVPGGLQRMRSGMGEDRNPPRTQANTSLTALPWPSRVA